MSEHFNIKKNDLSPAIKYQITLDEGQTLVGASAIFRMKDISTGVQKVSSAAVIDEAELVLSYEWQSGDTDTENIYAAEFNIIYADTKPETFPNEGFIRVVVGPNAE